MLVTEALLVDIRYDGSGEMFHLALSPTLGALYRTRKVYTLKQYKQVYECPVSRRAESGARPLLEDICAHGRLYLRDYTDNSGYITFLEHPHPTTVSLGAGIRSRDRGGRRTSPYLNNTRKHGAHLHPSLPAPTPAPTFLPQERSTLLYKAGVL